MTASAARLCDVADTTARTLRLLSLLQTHRFWPGAQLAERLGVSQRTLRRDVGRLRDLGYPVDAAPGVAGGYQLASGTTLPPLLLDDEDAVAIAVGLRAAADAAITGVEESAVRAMAKLEQLLPSRLRRKVDALHANVSVLRWGAPGPQVDPEVLTLAAQACRDAEEIRFEYRRRDGETSSRLVQPHGVVVVGRRWYLVAWDVRRDDWRTFRLDRMSQARLAGARFARREIPGGDTSEFVAASIRATPRSHRVDVVVAAPAQDVEAMARWFDASVEPLDSQRSRLELRAESVGELASMIAALAVMSQVAVVDAQAELAEALATTSERLRTSTDETRSPRTGTGRDDA